MFSNIRVWKHQFWALNLMIQLSYPYMTTGSHVQFCNPVNCSLSGSSVHGIFLASILEWIAIFYSRASFPPRDWTQVSCVFCIGKRIFTTETPGKPISNLYTYTNLGNENEKKENWSGKRSSLPCQTKSGEAKENNLYCSWVTDRWAYSPWLLRIVFKNARIPYLEKKDLLKFK